jgi:hypothetical protein
LSSTEAVLTSTDSVLHAELIRGRLEAAGIGARLSDTHTAGLGAHLTAMVGGVRVIVAREDIEAATAVLELEPFDDDALDDEALAAGAADSDSDDDGDDADDAGIVSSADVAARWALWSAGLSLLVPIGGQIGSLFMVWRALDLGTALSEAGRRRLRWAIVVDVATAALWWALLS